jgi:hypothetical protein
LEIDNDISYLPNSIEGYNKAEYRAKLASYKERTNFFLMKTILIQVSHITHQNEYYAYLKRVHDITYSMEEILKEITMMNQLIDDWLSKRKENRFSILSIIGSIFAFIQTFNNILGVYEYLPLGRIFSLYEFTGLSLLVSIFIGVLVWAISSRLRR